LFEALLRRLEDCDHRVDRLPERLDRDIGPTLRQVGVEEGEVLEMKALRRTGNCLDVVAGELTCEDSFEELRQSVHEHRGGDDAVVGLGHGGTEDRGELRDVCGIGQPTDPSAERLVEAEPREDRQWAALSSERRWITLGRLGALGRGYRAL